MHEKLQHYMHLSDSDYIIYSHRYSEAILKNITTLANFGAEHEWEVKLDAEHVLFGLGRKIRQFRGTPICEMLIDGASICCEYNWEFAEACAEALMRIGGREAWHMLADYNANRFSGRHLDGIANIEASFLNAVTKGYTETLKFLLDEGVDVNLHDANGKNRPHVGL